MKLFINMKPEEIPWEKTDPRYSAFWENEKEKVKNGIEIDGFYFTGWLYWHINHWKLTTDDTKDPNNINSDITIITPELRDNELIINKALHKAEKERKGIPIMGLRQMGKDLLNSSILYKEDCEITIGDCNIGDKIYDDSGNLTTITGKYPQGIKDVYKLSLMDGREIKCGLEHNWYVWDRIKKQFVVKTTKELLLNYKLYRDSWKERENSYEFRYYIPTNSPVKYSKKDLPIDPYILGSWLGDGTSSKPQFTNIDEPLIDKLRNLNLLNNKHIPKEYFYSSIEQRLELLRGLMDTDGWCDKDGTIGFCTTSKQLSEDFYRLCRSLGINLYKYKKKAFCYKDEEKIQNKDAYMYNIYTDLPIFKLQRKLDNVGKSKKRFKDKTAIVNIELVGRDNTTCITVDNDSHLFLTDNYTITHNTSFMASFGGRAGVIFKNSQNLLMGTNADDLNNITQNMDFGLLNCTPYFRIPRISRDWDSERVLLGVKSKVGDNIVHSTYVIRNTTGGKKTEKGAGVSNLKCNLWDEIGKDDFLSALTATKPAMLSANGWRTIPICSGTGGNVEKAKDAKSLFFNPSSHNFLEYVQPDGRVTGLFMPGWLRQDCKYKTTLAEYLIKEGELTHIPENSELWLIPVLVSNKEKAIKKINEELDSYLKAGNTTEYNRWRAYYPLSVDDIFLTESNNNFPVESIKPYIEKLNREFQVEAVELYKSAEGKIKTRGSDKEIITKFPVEASDNKDAPICIAERPLDELPFGAYVGGLDPYNENESSDRVNSLGSLYIFKRVHDPLGDYQYSPVAWYVARPKTLKEFKENCLLLMEYYNAYTLIERSNTALIDWFIDKGKGYLLADGLDIAKEINPKSSTRAVKGLQPTAPNQRHGMDLIVEYTKEEFEVMTENDEIREVLGFTRIKDPMLLTEMVNYRAKPSFSNGIHDGNFDRCFVKGELVLTDKGYKEISSLKIGESVLTHTGNFKPIIETFKSNYNKNIYSIKPLGSDKPILCTENHPFLVGNYSKKPQGKNWYNRKQNLDLITWKNAKDIKEDDFLFIPLRKNRVKRELNDDELYLLGWYLGDGHISKQGNLRICFQGDQYDIALYVKSLLEKYDDFNPTYFYTQIPTKNEKVKVSRKRKKPRILKVPNKYCYNLECTSHWFNAIVDKYITIKEGGEKILNSNLINQENLIPLILGFLEADGHQKFCNYDGSNGCAIEVAGTYLTLIRQFRDIILNERIWCTISPTVTDKQNSNKQLRIDIQDWNGINRIVENSKKFVKIDIKRKQRENFILKEDGFWIPISKIYNFSAKTDVYNIEVEEDHSYTVGGIATHNCVAFYHAVILAKHLDKYSPVIVKRKEDDEYLGRNVILHSALPVHKTSSQKKSKNTYLNSPFSLRR